MYSSFPQQLHELFNILHQLSFSVKSQLLPTFSCFASVSPLSQIHPTCLLSEPPPLPVSQHTLFFPYLSPRPAVFLSHLRWWFKEEAHWVLLETQRCRDGWQRASLGLQPERTYWEAEYFSCKHCHCWDLSCFWLYSFCTFFVCYRVLHHRKNINML